MDETPVSDEILMHNIAMGRRDALRAFYDRHAPKIYRFAISRLGDGADAAEVLNDVMLDVWHSAKRFEYRSTVSTWILGITHHKTVDLLRRRGRIMPDACTDVSTTIPDNDHVVGDDVIAAARDSLVVRKCLNCLNSSYRQVVYLAFFEDRSYSEIARILDCPEGTVKTRVFHAKDILKRCLEQYSLTTIKSAQPEPYAERLRQSD